MEAAAGAGKTAAMAAVENGPAIEEDPAKLETLAERGVKYMPLTHAKHLSWAASSGEAGDGPGGLTAFGREVVLAMEGLGAIVHLDTICGYLEHVVAVGGEEAVASGSDFDGVTDLPRGITGYDVFPVLLDGLRGRSGSEDQLRKLARGNFLRVLKATE